MEGAVSSASPGSDLAVEIGAAGVFNSSEFAGFMGESATMHAGRYPRGGEATLPAS